MSSPSIAFHKIWIDQCAAAEDIRETFGVENALSYLIGEKLFIFLTASEQNPQFAAEVPAFAAEIRRLFTATEISDYFHHMEHAKFFAPPDLIWTATTSTATSDLGPRTQLGVPKRYFDSHAPSTFYCRNVYLRSNLTAYARLPKAHGCGDVTRHISR